MKKYQHERRSAALGRLEAQLESGNKTTKNGTSVSLTDKDTKRIDKEIATLKSRL